MGAEQLPATPALVRIYVTLDPLAEGVIPEVWAEIDGDVAIYSAYRYRASPEGRAWHRTRWAAENYARQLQNGRIAALREEIARLERMRFGRHGA